MGAIQEQNLSRQLLGNAAQLFLFSTDPERFSEQIAATQTALSGIVHAFIKLGKEDQILKSVGPLLLSSLRPSLPPDSEIDKYLATILVCEPKKKPQTLTELITSFDNIIILLGKKASGKGTVSQILNEDYGFPNMPTSDWLRAIAAARGYPESFNPTMLRKLGDKLRQEFGGEVLVWLTLQEYALKDHKNVVFDGLRSETEMAQLISSPNVTFIWVDAPDEKRLERAQKRARPEDPQTIQKLLGVNAKTFPEAERLKRLCRYSIDNPGDDILALKEKTNTLMVQLSINKPNIPTLGRIK